MLPLIVLLVAGSPLAAQPIDCTWTREAYSKRATGLAVDKPGTSTPMTAYWPDPKGAAKEVFEKLQQASGMIAVELHFSACQGGALAYTPSMHAPAGKVVVCDELFGSVRDKDQLAAVLGHELGHIDKRHSDTLTDLDEKLRAKVTASFADKNLSEAQQIAILEKVYCAATQKASRDAEREADAEGIIWMKKAGYNTEAAAAGWKVVQDTLWVAGAQDSGYSHPVGQERAENAAKKSDDLKGFQRNAPAKKP